MNTVDYCDPKLKEELGRISLELDLEETMAEACEQMEIMELFNEAELHGDGYARGFESAFWTSRDLLFKYMNARRDSSSQKYEALNKRWGLG